MESEGDEINEASQSEESALETTLSILIPVSQPEAGQHCGEQRNFKQNERLCEARLDFVIWEGVNHGNCMRFHVGAEKGGSQGQGEEAGVRK